MAAAVLALVAYWSTLQVPVSGDASAHVYTAFSIVREGNADLDEYGEPPPPFLYHGREIGGHRYAPYLPGNAALFVPFAAVANAFGVAPASHLAIGVLAKLVASLLVAVSAAAVYLAVRRLVVPGVATYLTMAYALGTFAFATASQLYLEHAATLALVATAIALVIRAPASSRAVACAGALAAFAVVVRPTSVFVLLTLLLVLGRADGRQALRFALWGAPALAFLIAFDELSFGSPFILARGPFEPGDPVMGVLGLLVSPSRGLLVYGPWIAFALAGFVLAWRGPADQPRWLLRFGSLAFLMTLAVFGSYAEWWSGWFFGDRYLGDLAPVYTLAVADLFRAGRLASPAVRGLLAVAVGWSILLEAIGAGLQYFYWRGLHWDARPDIFTTPDRLWDWGAAQWQFLFARLVLDPPAAMWVELAALAAIIALFARHSRIARGPV